MDNPITNAFQLLINPQAALAAHERLTKVFQSKVYVQGVSFPRRVQASDVAAIRAEEISQAPAAVDNKKLGWNF